jgi:hypothetical protein
MKVAISPHVGGFSISDALFGELGIPTKLYGILLLSDIMELGFNGPRWLEKFRSSELLINAIEKIGPEKATYREDKPIVIIEIPDGVDFRIWEAEDGSESIHEVHRVWTEDGERLV